MLISVVRLVNNKRVMREWTTAPFHNRMARAAVVLMVGLSRTRASISLTRGGAA